MKVGASFERIKETLKKRSMPVEETGDYKIKSNAAEEKYLWQVTVSKLACHYCGLSDITSSFRSLRKQQEWADEA